MSLGDTIGVGTPKSVLHMLDEVLTEVPADKVKGIQVEAPSHIKSASSFNPYIFTICNFYGKFAHPGYIYRIGFSTLLSHLDSLNNQTPSCIFSVGSALP